ncbi:surface-adhesin E family protein [Rhodanobacter fulvus]|uniref:surface-adhesin E family protein n=1 Tax=Rhodanobacter fulvus TaxID=219571 RepID=UPI0012E9E97D|nr:surface-adhesin E family protein [Rhodanobacter fulvus]
MNVIRCLLVLGGCVLGQNIYAQAAERTNLQAKGVLYRCTTPTGGIKFTNEPNMGCVVISFYQIPQWRRLGGGGNGHDAWQLSIDGGWKEEGKGTQGWVMWNFANSRTRKLSGDRYKVIIEHVSADCHKALITTDKRAFYAQKATDKPLASHEMVEREEVIPGTPGALVLREFCS